LVSVVKFIADRGLSFGDDQNVGSPREFKNFQNFFSSKYLKKENAILLAAGFATVSQSANHC